jgi:hypothetical protein
MACFTKGRVTTFANLYTMNQNIALHDENINAQVPTKAEIGRQVKRVKTALAMSTIPDLPLVTDEVVGQRATKCTEMSLMNIANNPNGDQAGLIAIVVAAIQQACLPNGAISNAISNAMNNSIENLELRMEARYMNSVIRNKNVELIPLSNRQGHVSLDSQRLLGLEYGKFKSVITTLQHKSSRNHQ